MTGRHTERRRRFGEPELDHGDDPITWAEILKLLRRRPLLIRRIIDGIAGDPEPWDPEAP